MILRYDVSLTLSWTSQLKHLLLRAFLEDCPPEMLSKVCVLAERPMEGRVWDALLGQDPADPANPVNPLNPLSVPECAVWSNTPTLFADVVKSDTLVLCFIDFFLDLPAKTPTFESLFGRVPARNALESRYFRWEVHEKVNTTSSESSSGLGRLWRSAWVYKSSVGLQVKRGSRSLAWV